MFLTFVRPAALLAAGLLVPATIVRCAPRSGTIPSTQEVSTQSANASATSPLRVRVLPSQPTSWNSVLFGAGGFVTGLATHPRDPNLLYARTDVGGIYRRDRARNAWVPLLDGVRFSEQNLWSVDALALDPNDTRTLYVAAGGSRWNPVHDVLKSTNGGASWTRLHVKNAKGEAVMNEGNGPERQAGTRLAVDPRDSKRVFFATRRDGLLRSQNGGKSWQPVAIPKGDDYVGVTFVLFDARPGSRTVYAGVHADASQGGGVYRSLDGGNAWTRLEGDAPNTRPMQGEVARDGTFYVSGIAGWETPTRGVGGVWRYKSGAWNEVTPQRGLNYAALAVSPVDARVLMCGEARGAYGTAVFVSRDGGASWREFKRDLPNAQRVKNQPWDSPDGGNFLACPSDIAFDPLNPRRVWVGWWGGVMSCEDVFAPVTRWSSEYEGMELLCLFDMTSTPVGTPLFSGVMDVDGFRHPTPRTMPQTNLGGPLHPEWKNTWSDTAKMDFCEADPKQMARVGGWKGQRLGGGAYSLDNGLTWQAFATKPSPDARFGRIAVSATNPRVMVWMPMGNDEAVYWTRDRGQTWAVCEGLPRGFIYGGEKAEDDHVYTFYQPLTSDRTAPDTFYIYDRRDGSFYASTNGGATWQKRASLPKQAGVHYDQHGVTSLPGRAGEVWAALNEQGLFRSRDGGASWQKVEGVTRAYRFAIGKGATKSRPALYLFGELEGDDAPDAALFRSLDGGTSWARLNDRANGLANITALAGDRQTFGRVYVGTGGRGIFYNAPVSAKPSGHARTASVAR